MTTQHITSPKFKPVVRAILVGLAIVILCGILDAPARRVGTVLCSAAQQALVLLPSFALTASQALQPEAFDHQQLHLCAFETLVLWPLLHSVVKTV
jgi:uncharacterized protein (DUF486 family)